MSKLDLKAAHADLRPTSLTGSVNVDHRDNRQLVAVDLRQKDMRVEGNAEVTSERVNIQHLLARAGGAQLRASGSVGGALSARSSQSLSSSSSQTREYSSSSSRRI